MHLMTIHTYISCKKTVANVAFPSWLAEMLMIAAQLRPHKHIV